MNPRCQVAYLHSQFSLRRAWLRHWLKSEELGGGWVGGRLPVAELSGNRSPLERLKLGYTLVMPTLCGRYGVPTYLEVCMCSAVARGGRPEVFWGALLRAAPSYRSPVA